MPTYEVMREYRESYLLARKIFANLIEQAQSTRRASKLFRIRQQSLASGRVIPHDPEDQVGKEILRDSFEKHFSRYTETIETVRALGVDEFVEQAIPKYAYTRPFLVARKVGRGAIGSYKNYMPKFVPQPIAV